MILFPETKLTCLARQSRYRHHWFVDLLIAILLFIISASVQGMLSLTVLLVRLICGYLFSGSSDIDPQMLLINSKSSSGVTLLNLYLSAALIIIPVFYCTMLEQRSLASLGFSHDKGLLEYAVGLFLGFGMFSAAVGICYLAGSVTVQRFDSNPFLILAFFFGYLIQGMSEEVFCRGFLLQTLSIRNQPCFAIVLSSLFFASLHLFNEGITLLSFINLFLFGVFACVYMWRRGSIWGIAAAHSAWNYAQGNLFGIHVSGLSSGPSVFKTVFVESRVLWNGGAFGLEGGLAVTFILLLSTVLLLASPPKEISTT